MSRQSLLFVAIIAMLAAGAMSFSSPKPSFSRKPGVSEPKDIKAFVEANKDKVVVVDVRADFETREDGPLPGNGVRPQAINLVWDREAANMPLPTEEQVPSKDTPIITHCGGGGRGQKSCDFLKDVRCQRNSCSL